MSQVRPLLSVAGRVTTPSFTDHLIRVAHNARPWRSKQNTDDILPLKIYEVWRWTDSAVSRESMEEGASSDVVRMRTCGELENGPHFEERAVVEME